jgi:O-antigen ligase
MNDKRVQNNPKNKYFVFVSILLFLFCLTKVLRGSDTDSIEAGGIWNYISLTYYPLFVLMLAAHRRYRLPKCFMFAGFYALVSMLMAVSYLTSLSLQNIYYFLMIPYFILVMYVFYRTATSYSIAIKLIEITFYACLVVNLYSILIYRVGGAPRSLASDIYYSMGLYPFILMISDKQWKKVVSSSALFVAVFFSGKRTGLIAFCLAIVAYILVEGKIRNLKKKKTFFSLVKVICLLVIFVIAIYYSSKFFDSTFNLRVISRLNSLFEDGGSNRDVIYKMLWDNFRLSSFFEKLFGHGMYATESITGFLAHQDFLEILFDYGFIAFIFFFMFYISLFFECIKMIKYNYKYASAFCVSVLIGLLLSMFSFLCIYFTYVTCLSAFWGTCLSFWTKEKAERRHKSELRL